MEIKLNDLISLNGAIAKLYAISAIVDDSPACKNLAGELSKCASTIDAFYNDYVSACNIEEE